MRGSWLTEDDSQSRKSNLTNSRRSVIRLTDLINKGFHNVLYQIRSDCSNAAAYLLDSLGFRVVEG